MVERAQKQLDATSPAKAHGSPPEAVDDPDDVVAFNIDIRKLIISAFVIFHVLAVTVWLMPERSPRQALVPFFYPYMATTGSWQLWTMFAPNPASLDVWVEAKIDYGDGSHRSWDYMRMHNLTYVQRYDDERFRKMIENAHSEDNQRIWPYLARYAAIVNDRHTPGTYPMTVHLIRHFRLIAAPPMHPTAFDTHEFYSHTYIASPLAHRSRD